MIGKLGAPVGAAAVACAFAGPALRVRHAHRRGHQRIAAQLVVIVEILVAGSQCIDALGEESLQSMLDTPRITPIGVLDGMRIGS